MKTIILVDPTFLSDEIRARHWTVADPLARLAAHAMPVDELAVLVADATYDALLVHMIDRTGAVRDLLRRAARHFLSDETVRRPVSALRDVILNAAHN